MIHRKYTKNFGIRKGVDLVLYYVYYKVIYLCFYKYHDKRSGENRPILL